MNKREGKDEWKRTRATNKHGVKSAHKQINDASEYVIQKNKEKM